MAQIPIINTQIGSDGITFPQIDIIGRVGNWFVYEFDHYTNIFPVLKSIVTVFTWVSLPVSLFAIVGIIIAADGLRRVRRIEHARLYAHVVEAEEEGAAPDPQMATRWEKVQAFSESTNENDWRQAIIEADIMLEDLLIRLGYQGAGVGERLRRANAGDFVTLDKAGEAHGVRNRIAHDGSNFVLTHYEVKRVISLYREVFQEFYYI